MARYQQQVKEGKLLPKEGYSFTIYLPFLCETGDEAEVIGRLSPRQRTTFLIDRSNVKKVTKIAYYNRLLKFFVHQADKALDPVSTSLILDIAIDDAFFVLEEMSRYGRLRRLRKRHLWVLRDATLFEEATLAEAPTHEVYGTPDEEVEDVYFSQFIRHYDEIGGVIDREDSSVFPESGSDLFGDPES